MTVINKYGIQRISKLNDIALQGCNAISNADYDYKIDKFEIR